MLQTPMAVVAPIINKVGLQLLLEPTTSSVLLNSASVAIGAVYPAYATYKFLTRERYQPPPPPASSSGSNSHYTPSPQHYPNSSSQPYGYPPSSSSSSGGGGPDGERLLKYWAVAGGLYLGERLMEPFLAKFPYYPHAKFALLAWLLMDQCKGAAQLFDCHLVPALLRYEVKVDVCLEAGYTAAAALYSIYRIPLQQATALASFAARHLLTFLRWLATPEAPPHTPRLAPPPTDKLAAGSHQAPPPSYPTTAQQQQPPQVGAGGRGGAPLFGGGPVSPGDRGTWPGGRGW